MSPCFTHWARYIGLVQKYQPLQRLPIVTWISIFKQQTIVGGQYFNVPKPTEFWVDYIKLTQRFGSCMVKDPPSDRVLQLFVG